MKTLPEAIEAMKATFPPPRNRGDHSEQIALFDLYEAVAAPPPCTQKVRDDAIAELDQIRRMAQDRADFWYEQSHKNEGRREHYEVLSSQFQRIADDIAALSTNPGEQE